jgi:hypothetical protein
MRRIRADLIRVSRRNPPHPMGMYLDDWDESVFQTLLGYCPEDVVSQ